MKLSSLTLQDKIKLAAELDGYVDFDWLLMSEGLPRVWHCSRGIKDNKWTQMPNYATSYDAIIPLIQKQSDDVKGVIVSKFGETYNGMGLSYMQYCAAGRILMATPSQLLDALLVATGKATI
jgi:hypothetical protein